MPRKNLVTGCYDLRVTSRLGIVALSIALSTSIGWASARDQQIAPTPSRPTISAGSYVGEQSCAACHRDKTTTFARTAHHLTSAPATRASLSGPFEGPGATMKTLNPNLVFQMEARRDGFYQTAITGTPPNTTSRSARFDIVTGSGRKGKTFLSWAGDALVQLPVSYWVTPGHWINSPGYGDGSANFDRAVMPRCLECHATFFQVVAAPNHYDTTNFVLGLTCEKCHGPGRDHVTRMSPGAGRPAGAGGIVNTGNLAREQQLELCATCHGGSRVQPRGQSFTYKPGDNFNTHYVTSPLPAVPDVRPEVHGNQVDLLRSSPCFKNSQMTCSTCHDVHKPQRDIVAMSGSCLTCHKTESCGLFPKSGARLAGQCVECHMPNQTSNRVSVTTQGVNLQPKFRNHLIKVYPTLPSR
jgi:hypothetical protein